MYIILIAWLYVTVLMAASETNWVAGVLTFVFYGFLPASLFWWLLGGRVQLKHQAKREAQRARSLPNPVPDQRD